MQRLYMGENRALNKKPSKRRANTTFEPTSHLSTVPFDTLRERIGGIGTYLGIGCQASGIRFQAPGVDT
jgi:hypothetical protein